MIPSIEQLPGGKKCYCYDSSGIRTIAEVLSYTFSLDSAYKIQKQQLETTKKELLVKQEESQNLQKQSDLSNQQVDLEKQKTVVALKEVEVEKKKAVKQKIKTTFVEVVEGIAIVFLMFIAVHSL